MYTTFPQTSSCVFTLYKVNSSLLSILIADLMFGSRIKSYIGTRQQYIYQMKVEIYNYILLNKAILNLKKKGDNTFENYSFHGLLWFCVFEFVEINKIT